eukprot:TRINITY_DN8852_c0_g1_i1.p1 TRINITY_DN8852_c0_g1~~TRINITY_DN8852_c0_g1_i1.p1  ORF type:complete len:523 (+),score=93.76 TRINITY_DN8852_c0_g1_i1:165-1571(+)
MKVTLTKLNNIGNEFGSRQLVTGFNATVDFLSSQLQALPCDFHVQEFTAISFFEYITPKFVRISPKIQYQYGVDFYGAEYGGSGFYNLTASITTVNNYGCDISDFTAVNNQTIVLIEIGGCRGYAKALNAQQAGALAVILYNNNVTTTLSIPTIRNSTWYPGDPLVDIPVLMASYSVGVSLKYSLGSVNIITNTSIVEVPCKNIWCDTIKGNPNSTIVVGAHMDSVLAGHGINDNGSGVSVVLEFITKWLTMNYDNANRIRFAFWGAEEEGLLGSRNYIKYVKQNHPEEFNNIALALNFDMIGSPNYAPHIGLFPANDPNAPESGRNGSNVVTKMFEGYFKNVIQKNFTYITFGSSDCYSFVESGIPAGRVHAGSGGKKSVLIRENIGGIANAPYDPCYHQYCDDIENINYTGLQELSQAAAYVLQTVAMDPHLRTTLNPVSTTTKRSLGEYNRNYFESGEKTLKFDV